MSRLSIEAIKIVQAIKTSGSFSTASAILHKTPSAISYRVSSIEERLGVKLFHRNGPVITLTEKGKMLLHEGEWIINAIDCLEQRITTKSRNDDHFRIAIDSLYPIELIQHHVEAYLHVKHHLRLDIFQMSEGQEWVALHDNLADLIVTTTQHPAHIEANSRLMGNSELLCLTGAAHPFVNLNRPVDKAQLTNDILILQNDDLMRVSTRYNHISPSQKKLVVSSMSAKIDFLKNGFGHAFLPKFSVSEQVEKGMLKVINTDLKLGDEAFWLAWHPCHTSKSLDWWQQRFFCYSSVPEQVTTSPTPAVPVALKAMT